MEPVAAKTVGTGNFVIGAMKVRPRVPPRKTSRQFSSAVRRSISGCRFTTWKSDQTTHKASATFEYDITNKATNKAVVHTVESTDKMGNVGDQVTLQKTIAAAGLDPGVYRIQIKVNDNISKQTVTTPAEFAVE